MATFVLSRRHRPQECRIAIAAWRGFDSPLRDGCPLGCCISGRHGIRWIVEASDNEAALAQLPPYVAERTTADEVTELPLP
jgi:hypothetical protein